MNGLINKNEELILKAESREMLKQILKRRKNKINKESSEIIEQEQNIESYIIQKTEQYKIMERELQNQIQGLKSEIKQLKIQLKNKPEQINVSELYQQIKIYQKKQQDHDSQIHNLKKKESLKYIEFQRQISALTTELTEVKAINDDLKQKFNIKSVYAEEVELSYQQYKNKYKKLQMDYRELQEEMNKYKNSANLLRQKDFYIEQLKNELQILRSVSKNENNDDETYFEPRIQDLEERISKNQSEAQQLDVQTLEQQQNDNQNDEDETVKIMRLQSEIEQLNQKNQGHRSEDLVLSMQIENTLSTKLEQLSQEMTLLSAHFQ